MFSIWRLKAPRSLPVQDPSPSTSSTLSLRSPLLGPDPSPGHCSPLPSLVHHNSACPVQSNFDAGQQSRARRRFAAKHSSPSSALPVPSLRGMLPRAPPSQPPSRTPPSPLITIITIFPSTTALALAITLPIPSSVPTRIALACESVWLGKCKLLLPALNHHQHIVVRRRLLLPFEPSAPNIVPASHFTCPPVFRFQLPFQLPFQSPHRLGAAPIPKATCSYAPCRHQ